MTLVRPQDLQDLAQSLLDRPKGSKFISDPAQEDCPAEQLISLMEIPELKCIRKHCCSLSVGVMCTPEQTMIHPLVRNHFPSLLLACQRSAQNGHLRSTIGGSLCNCARDEYLFPVLLSLDARAAVVDDTRQMNKVHVETVFSPEGKLALADNTVITDFFLPIPLLLQETHCAFAAREQNPELILAIYVKLEDEEISHARAVLGGITPRAYRVESAEAYLLGKAPEDLSAAELISILQQELAAHGATYPIGAVDALVTEALTQLEEDC